MGVIALDTPLRQTTPTHGISFITQMEAWFGHAEADKPEDSLNYPTVNIYTKMTTPGPVNKISQKQAFSDIV